MAADQMLWDFQSYSDRPALICDHGETITYKDLLTLGCELADIDQGRPRPLVMMLCRNTPGALYGYGALQSSGYPLLMISAEIPAQLQRQVMNQYRPAMIFVPEKLRGEYAHLQTIRTVRDYLLLKTNYPSGYPVDPRLCQLLTTSGSTGSVKYVRQSRTNVMFNASAIADYLGLTQEDRSITSLPLQYTYSLSMLHAAFLRGAATVVTSYGLLDNEFWDLMEDQEVTLFHGVPNTYEIMYKMEMFSEDFPALKTLTQAGGKLNRELHAFVADYARTQGKKFIVMYGQSEATAAITWLPAEKSFEKAGSVGIVIPGGTVSLQSEDGNTVTAPHVQGEIVYFGDNVSMGYALGGEDLNKGDERGGLLRTGDLGEFDEDGFLYIVGRLKRVIKISGHRISLDEIDENILKELNIFCVSSGTDDHLVIFVTSESDRDAVNAWIRKDIHVVRNCFETAVIAEFPKNESGKILYGKLQDMAESIISEGK